MRKNFIVWGCDKEIFKEYFVSYPIASDVESHCHALITGASGSGKSYSLLFLIRSMLVAVRDIRILIFDFKNSSDFSFLEGYSDYYCYESCYEGLKKAYEIFSQKRKKKDENRYLIIFDEYPSFIHYLTMKDKAEKTHRAQEVMAIMAEILMMGRGLGFGCWIVTQRADASLFPGGSRDNFMVIVALGNLSKEQKNMLFSGEDLPNDPMEVGEGILWLDGVGLKDIIIPEIKHVDAWKRGILKSLLAGSGTRDDAGK